PPPGCTPRPHRGAGASPEAGHGKKPAGSSRPAFAHYPGFCPGGPAPPRAGGSTLPARAAGPQGPRTSHSASRPAPSTMPPMARTWRSSMASSCAAARFQAPGAANRNRPSSTATRLRAAQRSFMAARMSWMRGRRDAALPRHGRAARGAWSTVVAQVLQEGIVAFEHDHAVAVGERGAVRLQAAQEGVEGGIAAGRLGVDPRGLGITLAAQLLRVALGLGHQHGALAVGLGADDARLLLAFRAQAGGHLLALGAHAVVDLRDDLAVGRQVDLLEADVHNPHAQRFRAFVD